MLNSYVVASMIQLAKSVQTESANTPCTCSDGGYGPARIHGASCPIGSWKAAQ